MNYNELFELLASDNSRNFKLRTLKEHENDETLKRIIVLALDPFINFYQRKIPKYTPNDTDHAASLKSMLPSLNDLSSRSVTGNAAIDRLKNMLEAVEPSGAKVIERIIKKDLKCGVSISTVNAVWPNLIAEYPVMLCSKYEDKLVDKIKWPAIVQKKEDGMRFNAIVKNGTVDFRSRNGKEIQLLGNLEQEFIALAAGRNVVFDGELLVMDEFDYQFCDRQTGNGILNKANKGTIKDAEAKLVHAQLWDIIDYDDFVTGSCVTPYFTRLSLLQSLPMAKKIHLVETHYVQNLDEARKIFSDYLNAGFEGIILKDSLGTWENKRTKSQIKFKGELECDLKIVDIEEGTGKYVGKLGAIICESNDSIIRVSVGSGFSDDQRTNLTKDYLIGKVVAVKYNARIKNKQGEESLFLPIFIEIREDKDVADISADIA